MEYCIACGAVMENGICTNEKCRRRVLQMKAAAAKTAAETAKNAAEQERLSARAGAKAAYLSADAQTKAALGINADWL